MSNQNKSYRIRTQVGVDNHYINFNINQSYNKFEILSLEINQSNMYKLMQSETGVVVGRVVANGGFGIPNAKLSIFIEYDGNDSNIQNVLYRYSSSKELDVDGIRYNLLFNDSGDDCHQNVGTFPTKRYLLDNNDVIEVFDKYYKYTTRTNNSGDYMIYGVPTGNNVLHCDIDLSDIGVLSQTPRDMMYKGYNKNSFESASKFRKDTNLNNLPQLITQDKSLYVYPFWGDTTENQMNASITRCDIQVDYKFESTCVFIGSVITDTGENAIGKRCIPSKKGGKMSDMTTGTGMIEMIRKTANGSIEQFSVQGNQLIDSNGTWCYQIPMNLDYVITDEYGNIVLSDNPDKGIATRAKVRFRISMTENPADGVARKRARYLVPNNPRLVEDDYPSFSKSKSVDYEFGSKTKDENFRDLMWNNVYTVKNYIPRLQKSRLPNNLRHLGIKKVNHPGANNPMPYNKLNIKFNFMYTFICVLIKVLVSLTRFVNIVVNFFEYSLLSIAKLCATISNLSAWPRKWTFLAGINNTTPDQYNNGNSIYNDKDCSLWDKIFNDCEEDKNKGDKASTNWVNLCLTQICLASKALPTKDINTWVKRTGNYGKGLKVEGLGAILCGLVVKIGPGIKLEGLCEDENGNSLDITPVNRDGLFWTWVDESGATCLTDINTNIAEFYNCIENQLAQENEVTSFNFYNDWVNGVLYLPLWFRKIKPKRTFLGIQINPQRERWCNGAENVKARDLKVYNNCVIKRNITGSDNLQPLSDDYQTVNVNKSKADDDSGVEKLVFKKENDSNCFGFKCHKYGRSETPLPTGLIIEKETMLGDKVYYYKPSFYSKDEKDMVTLFATDIVLLGSLNNCDLHGIPQFFKILEGTTYQMPPDLLSEDYYYKNISNMNNNILTDENESELIDNNSKRTEYTGADWGNLGVDQSNYKDGDNEANENIYDNGGLFYGLTCWDSYTKPKSIINLERICEIGVSLDESQELLTDKSTLNGSNVIDNDILYTNLPPDGYISYDEIYNPDYRSMFATMNGNFLKTKLNLNTGLVEYDLTHVYLDNFDGSLSEIMAGGATHGNLVVNDVLLNEQAKYKNNYKLEVKDKNYINFRYGNYKKNNNKLIYYYQFDKTMTIVNGQTVNSKNKFPRYENSFYFYFGLKNGSTAIDRFYSDYYADCTPNQDFGKAFEFSFEANEWCSGEGGYIEFKHELDLPIKLKLINKDNENIVYTAENINYNNFRVGYKENYNSNYVDLYLNVEIDNVIKTGNYYIEIVDNNGDVYNDEIEFHKDYLTYEISTQDFSLSNDQLLNKYRCDMYVSTVTDGEGNEITVTPKQCYDFGSTFDGSKGRGYIHYAQGIINPTTGTVDLDNIEYMTGYEDWHLETRYNFTTFELEYWMVKKDENGQIIDQMRAYTYYAVNYYDENNTIIVQEYTQLKDINNDNRDDIMSIVTSYNQGYRNLIESDIPTLDYWNMRASVDFNETDDGYDRTDGGYIMISNVTSNFFKVEIKGTNKASNWCDGCVVKKGINEDLTNYVNVDILNENQGFIGYKNDVLYFGVPVGNETYQITITEMCVGSDGESETIIETSNSVISSVTIYEGYMKLYINGIDYDLIRNFKTGYGQKFMLNSVADFNSENIYGWNDVENIDVYKVEDNGSITSDLLKGSNSEYPYISPDIQERTDIPNDDWFYDNKWEQLQSIDDFTNSSYEIGYVGVKDDKIYKRINDSGVGESDWEELNYVEYSKYSNYYTGDFIIYNNVYYKAKEDSLVINNFELQNKEQINKYATQLYKKKNAKMVYNWDDRYILNEEDYEVINDDFELTVDENGRELGDENYINTFGGGIYNKCDMINEIIEKRIDLTYQMMGNFRLTTKKRADFNLTVSTKSKPVQYLIVQQEKNNFILI